MEWSSKVNISESLVFGFSGNITEAEFTDIELEGTGLVVGDPINFIPEYSYSVNMEYSFSWINLSQGYFRMDYNRQGSNTETVRGLFVNEQEESDSVGFLNAKLGAQWHRMRLGLFFRNITNELRSTNASLISSYAQNRPRTVGLDFFYDF